MTCATIESALCSAYREQADCYLRALQTAELLSPTIERGESPEPLMERLTASLTQVGLIETRIAANKERWRQTGAQAGEELSGLLTHVAELIAALKDALASLEHHARREHAHAGASLDDMIRRQHMRRAYGQAPAS